MSTIGTQDGIHASVERLRKLDPGGTKPNRNPDDLATWGAWDKLERTLQILRDDHDTGGTVGYEAPPFGGSTSRGEPAET
ncbi:MAG TPA: hypothetical protein VKB57_23645 [Acidimicrobiales bacterium]|nr:hypothetical protein [Acidimicrobiales bacterium]